MTSQPDDFTGAFNKAAHAIDLDTLRWRKARRSESGACVEIARAGELVAIRDSKAPKGPVLLYTPEEWWAFLDGARGGEFDDIIPHLG